MSGYPKTQEVRELIREAKFAVESIIENLEDEVRDLKSQLLHKDEEISRLKDKLAINEPINRGNNNV